MHIVRKILDVVGSELETKYRVYVTPSDWEQFQEPLEYINGNLCRAKFECRQDTAIKIIEQILDIHGKIEIVGFLGRLAKIEPKIQELQPWVRDHVVHAIYTFLLGVYFLEKLDFPIPLTSRFDYPFMWKLCGPTHDLGYPIEIGHNINIQLTKEVNDILESIGSPSPRVQSEAFPKFLDRLCENRNSNALIQDRLNEWGLDININNYYLWLRQNNKSDHGVVSALAQLKVIDALYFRVNPKREIRDILINGLNYNQANFDFDVVSASSALFLHNIEVSYPGFQGKISFQSAPLAFLLFLCDTLQEWDRYSENKTVYSGLDFDLECKNNSISLYIPVELEDKISIALSKRLKGLTIEVNGNVVVT